MAPMSVGASYFNPYEATALQIAASRAQIVFRARHRVPLKQRLQASDELMDQVELCRIASAKLIPSELWQRVVRLAFEVDPSLPRRLGADRRPDRVGAILFNLQDRLLDEIRIDRSRGAAPVIPLFSAR